MGSDFFNHLVDQARYGQPRPAHSGDQDQPDTEHTMRPPITCPLCYSLVLEQAFTHHSEWHQRAGQ